jgi:hypothetical protein
MLEVWGREVARQAPAAGSVEPADLEVTHAAAL